MTSYCETHNIELRSTPGYSPFSNGYCEKMIGILKIALNLLVRGQGQSWIDMLGYANQRLLSSNYSPQMIALGQSSQSLALLKKDMDFENHKDFMEFMTKKLDKAYILHANERKRLADKNRE